MSENIDLSQLASHQSPSANTARVTSRWISRYVVPIFILAGFAGLIVWAARDSLLPSNTVSIVPVVVTTSPTQQAGAPLFKAAGWIEPRPKSIVVSSLAPGIINELLVVEGQLVRRNEVMARLLDTDAKIRLSEAMADTKLRQADLEAAEAELKSAELVLNHPIKLQAALADAQARLAEIEGELSVLPLQMTAADSDLDTIEQDVANKRNAGAAIAGRILREAENNLAKAKAVKEQLAIKRPMLERQRISHLRKSEVLKEQLRLKLDEHRRVASAQAALKAARAKLEQSQLSVETAKLQLDRLEIKSPLDGRVLSVHATAGMRVVGLDPHSEKGASAVVTLYDPANLQIRVDVRLEDVPKVTASQQVQIETASVETKLSGHVVGVTSEADIQKNTLQVKVAIDNPPDMIRPEMLAEVTFIATKQDTTKVVAHQTRLLIPKSLVKNEAGNAFVWLADLQTNRVIQQVITLGREDSQSLIEVLDGLRPTDKLIRSHSKQLKDGQRIRITSNDLSVDWKLNEGRAKFTG